VPSWIHPDMMEASFDKLDSQKVQYAKMLSYHKMCRWNSGLFYHHPALANYTWYWRVEPNVQYSTQVKSSNCSFFCEVDYDVFRFMELNDKTYGFVINIYDSPASIQSLWPTTLEYLALYPNSVHPNSAIEWVTDSSRRPGHNHAANGYSTCHFWSNFEIGNLNFWRSQRYQSYFDYLDRQGGFFYERWGDAPVHSVALGLFEDKRKIHWFHDIGIQFFEMTVLTTSQDIIIFLTLIVLRVRNVVDAKLESFSVIPCAKVIY
jgi:mannosyltransferase